MEARLQKILAQWGIASRREAEEMIRQSRVCVNGGVAHLGQKVDPYQDKISIDGKTVLAEQRPSKIYLLLHKPAGVVSTCYDPILFLMLTVADPKPLVFLGDHNK